MGSTGAGGSDCSNDGMSLKPSLGRGITDVLQSKGVSICGSSRCKTCVHTYGDR